MGTRRCVMELERPDLSQADPAVRAYVEALEAELARLQARDASEAEARAEAFSEPPTTLHVITWSASGVAKRTPRHLYTRQRRGGMGVFDLETPEEDPPAGLTVADEEQELLLFSSGGRAFRLPAHELTAAPVRGRGEPLARSVGPLAPGERVMFALPDAGGTYLALLSRDGYVRVISRPYLRLGTPLYDVGTFGPPTSACWTTGKGELFVATRTGRAIRFPERGLPVNGGPGIRLTEGDVAVAVVPVGPEDGVFLLGADGLGAIRLMSGFGANKAPGGGGKIALKTGDLVGAVAVGEDDDLFVLSRLSKLIRFVAEEVPAKEGVVQGVRCITLRADAAVAVAASPVVA